MLVFVEIYQVHLSGYFGGACRFHPSCSSYAHEALEKHNVFSALKMIVIRLSKCHPFGPYGYDPVIKSGREVQK